MRRRVVVTGLGLVSALGVGTDETWQAILAGRSGIARITLFDASRYSTRFAGDVSDEILAAASNVFERSA